MHCGLAGIGKPLIFLCSPSARFSTLKDVVQKCILGCDCACLLSSPPPPNSATATGGWVPAQWSLLRGERTTNLLCLGRGRRRRGGGRHPSSSTIFSSSSGDDGCCCCRAPAFCVLVAHCCCCCCCLRMRMVDCGGGGDDDGHVCPHSVSHITCRN